VFVVVVATRAHDFSISLVSVLVAPNDVAISVGPWNVPVRPPIGSTSKRIPPVVVVVVLCSRLLVAGRPVVVVVVVVVSVVVVVGPATALPIDIGRARVLVPRRCANKRPLFGHTPPRRRFPDRDTTPGRTGLPRDSGCDDDCHDDDDDDDDCHEYDDCCYDGCCYDGCCCCRCHEPRDATSRWPFHHRAVAHRDRDGTRSPIGIGPWRNPFAPLVTSVEIVRGAIGSVVS